MSEHDICRFNPEFPDKTEHRFAHNIATNDLTCEFCRIAQNDMTCYCAATLVSLAEIHTVGEHWNHYCGGFHNYRGPCGGCWECISLQVVYDKEEPFFEMLRELETQLREEQAGNESTT